MNSEPRPDGSSIEGVSAGALFAGRYRLVRLIGSGGMGTVWEGLHASLGTKVAIKFIKPHLADQAEARARFDIEARAAAKLSTKHAVHVYDHGLTPDGVAFIVMEFLEGESLSDAIVSRGPLPLAEAAKVIAQAAHALSKAHAAGVVHRDMKPDNILLARVDEPEDGLPYMVKVVDFGIAKMFDAAAPGGNARPLGGPTREGTVVGTPNFMAPELLTTDEAPGPLTDLWALGACAFAATTGKLPFEGDVLGEVVLSVCAAPMPVPSSVNRALPASFDAWFAKACNRDVASRFQNARQLAVALLAAAGVNSNSRADPHPTRVGYVIRPTLESLQDDPAPIADPMSPRTALLAGLVLGIAMMVGLLGLFAWREHAAAPAAADPSTLTARPASQAAP